MLPEPAGVIVVNHNPTPIVIHKEAPPQVTKVIHHIHHEEAPAAPVHHHHHHEHSEEDAEDAIVDAMGGAKTNK